MSILAEGVGFEPTKAVKPCRFSRPVHSTALPTLRARNCNRNPAVAANSGCNRSSILQEERLQVVEECLAERRRRDLLMVARDEPAPLRFLQCGLDRCHRQARALDEPVHWKPLYQPQRIKHEFERQIARAHFMLFL